MAETFTINGKIITVSDKADAEFVKKMGYELDVSDIECYLISAYAKGPLEGYKDPAVEEVTNAHSEDELSNAVSKEILDDMEDYV